MLFSIKPLCGKLSKEGFKAGDVLCEAFLSSQIAAWHTDRDLQKKRVFAEGKAGFVFR